MITSPVEYVGQDQQLVEAFEKLPRPQKEGEYWTSETLKDLKARVKTFYIASQKERCCYCDRHLATKNHRNWDVEHIVDRGKYPWFLLTPKNLAVACPDCNLAKSDKEVLVNRGRKTYPDCSDDFRLVHPHFDKYSDHVFRSRHIYLPKTSKGKFTIYLCDLLRFAEQYISWDNSASDTRFEAEVDAAFDGEEPLAKRAVEEIVEKLKQDHDG